MKNSDKNIIMITAGGVGSRFGADTPKQYLLINNRPVISYAIEAARGSKYADAVLVVADPFYHEELRSTYGVDVAANGAELNITKRNGLDYIKQNSSCSKVIVMDAVRPTIETAVIDRTFELLDEYDAVAVARKITDSLGHYGEWVVNREEYYTLSTPEGFRFSLLDKHFRADSKYTESIQQLPEDSKVYLNFDVPYFEKITYPEDLIKIEAILRSKERR